MLTGLLAPSAGSARVAAPTEQPGQHRGIDPAGLGPDADPRGVTGLLEQDRHLGDVGLGEQIDDALAQRRRGPGRLEVRVEERRGDDAPGVV